ncbi:5'/3'-nucleotidase SurE [Sphingomonas sp. YL-JM2C]
MKQTLAFVGTLIALTLCPAVADARNIVITNDDGLTSNVVALYKALKAEGHDVIVSVPCDNQSGMGAAIKIGQPLAPLRKACRAGAAPVGAPGAGAMARPGIPAADFHYVDGTPVMAMLYGVDVLGQQRWGKVPDLVLSGPNEGQNVGAAILGSGTVSAAQMAAVKGLSAIALSAGMRTVDDNALANPDSAKVAALSAELVARLDRLSGGGRILPEGLALNVNFPDVLEGAKWQASRIGTYQAYDIRFVADMARDPSPMMKAMTGQYGKDLPHLPGLSFGMNSAEPAPGQKEDESVVYRHAIAVSPMQAGYEPKALDGYVHWLVDRFDAGK